MYNKEAVFKYRKTHQDKINSYNEVYMPQYYLKNKDSFKNYYDENKDRIKQYDKLIIPISHDINFIKRKK